MRRGTVRALERYSIFGLVLESAIPMPELPRALDGGAPALRFSCASPTDELPHVERWSFASGPDSVLLISHRNQDSDSTLIRFPDRVDFHLDESFSSVLATSTPEVSESLVRHLFLDVVVPLSRSAKGELVLHAGSVMLGDGAVVVLGPSGSGKSTMVAALAQRGLRVLGDDAVCLRETPNGWIVVPSYPGIRLWPDSIKWLNADPRELKPVADEFDKVRWAYGVGDSPPTWPVLSQMVLLEEHPISGPAQIDPNSPRTALLGILEQSFYLPQLDRGATARNFELMGKLIDEIPIWTLRYERDYASLEQVVDTLLCAFGP